MKAGIICDEYKVPEFKKRLDNLGWNYYVGDLIQGLVTISVFIGEHEVKKLSLVCEDVENWAKSIGKGRQE